VRQTIDDWSGKWWIYNFTLPKLKALQKKLRENMFQSAQSLKRIGGGFGLWSSIIITQAHS